MMQQVPELVEDRLHLAVSQQCGLAGERRRQVAADQTQVRLQPGQARQESVHPGAAALVLTRIEIGVKGPQ